MELGLYIKRNLDLEHLFSFQIWLEPLNFFEFLSDYCTILPDNCIFCEKVRCQSAHSEYGKPRRSRGPPSTSPRLTWPRPRISECLRDHPGFIKCNKTWQLQPVGSNKTVPPCFLKTFSWAVSYYVYYTMGESGDCLNVSRVH